MYWRQVLVATVLGTITAWGLTQRGWSIGIAVNDDVKVYAAYELCGTDSYIGE